ncbi:MAG TPA: L,D-transpeptidase family protein [Sphingomicrobium sp.]|nr:L,D-transpeptidase family protein [Sphingomicrobium sp.]
MISKRITRAGTCPARVFSRFGGATAAIMLAVAPLPAFAASPAIAAGGAAQLSNSIGGAGVSDFYRARGDRPLWLAPQSAGAAQAMLGLLNSASVDGLNPERYQVRRIAGALRAAQRGDARAVNRAERMLSEAFVAYARDLRRAPNLGIVYVDHELRPAPPSARTLLDGAAAAPSLRAYVEDMGWMNPSYGQLRRALLARSYAEEAQRRTLTLNLERARALPAGSGRYVVVNAAAQRLFMYENGEVVDNMRVVVGKPRHATPMMTALIRYAALNPYWNVPTDLALERIVPNVLKGGTSYLRAHGYQVLSDWSDHPRVVDPGSVDWKAVAAGSTQVRLRQLPGSGNAMGRMKFMFPNQEGIYLHDTPEKELLTEAARLFSGGCIRLEDAPRLGRWLFGKPLRPQGASAEQTVPLPVPVPLYVTYLTAVPSGSSIAYFDDIYGRDAARLAQFGRNPPLASR